MQGRSALCDCRNSQENIKQFDKQCDYDYKIITDLTNNIMQFDKQCDYYRVDQEYDAIW